MKKMTGPAGYGALLALLLWSLAGAVVAATPDPYRTVKLTTDELLSRLVEIQPLFTEDEERFYVEVESSLAPFIDFDGFARSVMAKYYRRASQEQAERFQQVFQQGLIRTYSKALVQFDNQKVEILRDSVQIRDEGSRASVRLEVYAQDGTVYPVDYDLTLTGGQWKLRNIIINGINVGLQFRSQFSSYMRKHRNDMDAVIANWDVSVE